MKSESPQKQLASKIKSVNNILITVSRNPNVDQLASTLGLTMALNKLGKRSVAVFSGRIPSAIRFLNPKKTFENNADSLRDFIISISKDKADRLKVRPDGDFVKVYITPYRTKITPSDLKFEEGDFNIELIIAIGVSSRDELDASIASHGKIFHNAVTATLNLGQLHDALGMISWQDTHSGCYAQMCYNLIDILGRGEDSQDLVDEPIATALLTGVVSATDQFRNKVTTPEIMTLSANLMAKGANQQLITSELESADDEMAPPAVTDQSNADSRYDSMGFDRNDDNASMEQPAGDDMHIYELGQQSDERIEQRLREDRDDLGHQRSVDALQTAQARLLETEGSIQGDSKPLPPEAPLINRPTNQPTPKNTSPAKEQSPVDRPMPQPIPSSPVAQSAPSFTNTNATIVSTPAASLKSTVDNDSSSIPLPTPVPMPPMAPVQQSAITNGGGSDAATSSAPAQSQPELSAEATRYIGNPSGQSDQVMFGGEPNQPTVGSEPYLASNSTSSTIQPLSNNDELPFNQPNQVSPIQSQPVAAVATPPLTGNNVVANQPAGNNMPDLTQPLSGSTANTFPMNYGNMASTNADTTMQTASTINPAQATSLPLPPTPPAPAVDLSGMPPVNSQATSQPVNNSLANQQPIPSSPATQPQQSNDPSQFVIPS